MWFRSPVCVRPGRKRRGHVSHEATHTSDCGPLTDLINGTASTASGTTQGKVIRFMSILDLLFNKTVLRII